MKWLKFTMLSSLLVVAQTALAQSSMPMDMSTHMSMHMPKDTRQLVHIPKMLQAHMLHSMRDHLITLNEIMALMAESKLDKAADVAEHRIGMSSLPAHDAAQLAKYMPEGMRKAGTNMHRAASEFALVAQTGYKLKAYAALQKVTAACIACHSSYRIR